MKLVFRHTQIITSVCFEVCSPCNRKCRDCAHSDLMSAYHGFQLSLEELSLFLEKTEKSGYFIERIDIHGPGEPLLWTNLNEGIKMIYDADLVGRIDITTNGSFLNRIRPETFRYIDLLIVSLYPGEDFSEMTAGIPKKYHYKIQKRDITEFTTVCNAGNLSPIPCECSCHGPMFMKDKIFPYCGPVVFGAVAAKGDKISGHPYLYRNVDLNYMDGFNPSKIGNFDLCRYCLGNLNADFTSSPVTQIS